MHGYQGNKYYKASKVVKFIRNIGFYLAVTTSFPWQKNNLPSFAPILSNRYWFPNINKIIPRGTRNWDPWLIAKVVLLIWTSICPLTT